ncbi:hypothetical protein CALVIDRAFT_61060 [Calocera viscosa TUFC12733]|uniref:F-box domain-containing protein n=1 Tax=Calocera viscosa (strain TUFC12733) TaxID=1330018 RepID=A0A167NL25_CALVF|nr:hypothetical protein CALVIDRAFT_61060 [Calocera viscosa TUFC12733]
MRHMTEMLSLFPNKLISSLHSMINPGANRSFVYMRVPPELLEDILLLSVSAHGRPWRPLALSAAGLRRRLLCYALVCKRWAVVAFSLLYQSWDASTVPPAISKMDLFGHCDTETSCDR